eukprot:scaffold12183_cov68-Phaeocystis_antarctica.AAC.8
MLHSRGGAALHPVPQRKVIAVNVLNELFRRHIPLEQSHDDHVARWLAAPRADKMTLRKRGGGGLVASVAEYARRTSRGCRMLAACCAKHGSWLASGAAKSQVRCGQWGDRLASKKMLTKRLNGSRMTQ